MSRETESPRDRASLRCPLQPLEFLRWLSSQLSGPDLVCRQAMLGRDGTVSFSVESPAGRGSIRWSAVPGDGTGSLRPLGSGGWVAGKDVPEETLSPWMGALEKVIDLCDPPWLRWNPPQQGVVFFLESSFGALLREWIEPGVTRWGAFTAGDFAQETHDRMDFRFSTDSMATRAEVIIRLSVQGLPAIPEVTGTPFSREQFRFSVMRDTRSPKARHRLDGQVERLLGYAVARVLEGNFVLVACDPLLPPPVLDAGDSQKADACAHCTASDRTQRLSGLARHDAFVRNWHAEDRWRRFLYTPSHCITGLVNLGADDAYVSHESLECVLNEAPWLPPDSTFFHQPRQTRVGTWWAPCRKLVTDIQEQDIACHGGMGLLERAIQTAHNDPEVRSVLVHNGCLANVTGDNPMPIIRRLNADDDRRLYWVSATNDSGASAAQLIRDRLQEALQDRSGSDPLGVALVGGTTPDEDEELGNLLGVLGLSAMGSVLPDVSYRRVRRVARASWFVWAYKTPVADLATEIFRDLPVRLLVPDAPVGIRGTLTWLRHIVDAVRAEVPGGADPGPLLDRPFWEQDLRNLRARTRSHAVAFVVDPTELDVLLDRTSAYGFAALEVVTEMGFGVRLLTWGPPEAFGDRLAAAANLGESGQITSCPFSSPEELSHLLRQPEIGLVFSNFAADPRVTGAGKTVFSEVSFEMGIQGFLRTARSFLRSCERRPLARVQHFLGGTR